ncbi:HAD-like domain-containing protein [Pelagophyceae sp. CCMP2097]|nr:HAD-like domain-containing protein [Pelagophyceae sp. CCMP2097]
MAQCLHPARLGPLCAVCGAMVGDGDAGTERVALKGIKTGSAVRIDGAEAAHLARGNSKRLLSKRKLSLVLDLDHTLVECTTDARAAAVDGAFALQLGDRKVSHWIKLRPGLADLFGAVEALFELAIYTAGSREYAEAVAEVLEREFESIRFHGRIVSRDDCPDLTHQKELSRLFPGGARMALVVDDRFDVWYRGPQAALVVVVRPFKFFQRFFAHPEAFTPEDDQLGYTRDVLRNAHAAFFADGQEDAARDASHALAAVRLPVLAGCRLVVHPPLDAGARLLAEASGAVVDAIVTAATTHVVTLDAAAPAARSARGHVHVVHMDWLWFCMWRVRRESEARFYLVARTAAAPSSASAATPGDRTKRRRVDEAPEADARGAAAPEADAPEAAAPGLEAAAVPSGPPSGPPSTHSSAESDAGDSDQWAEDMADDIFGDNSS